MKANHGGSREGAGRKARQQPREALTIRVEPEISEKFKKVCESKNRSQSEQLTEWVKRARL